MVELLKGDCLIESDKIESGSVDLILTDLPYGVVKMKEKSGNYTKLNTAEKWDKAIEPTKIFEIANRILRKNGKMILFSQEPYTTKLITESIPNIAFGYRATWEKDNFANALGVNKAMVSFTEDVLVFSKNQCFEVEHPLRKILKKYVINYGKDFLIDLFLKEGRYTSELSARVHASYKFGFNGGARFDLMDENLYNYLCRFIKFEEKYSYYVKLNKRYLSTFNLWEGNKYKSNILKYKKDYDGHHPTQKPVLLLEDLIKTFTNENDLVVDLTMGSGSTMVACQNTNRNGIGIEMDENYFNIAKKRIEDNKLKLF